MKSNYFVVFSGMGMTGRTITTRHIFEMDLSGDPSEVMGIIEDRCREVFKSANKMTLTEYSLQEIISISKL